MKTKKFLALEILGSMAIIIASCSKEDDTVERVPLTVSPPHFRHIVDTIYTPFFTSGSYGFDDYLFWGNENGEISINAPNGTVWKPDYPYSLSWDQNLNLGDYPITLTATNSKGSAEDNFILVSSLGGYFVRTYNYHPASKDEMSKPQSFYFEPNGHFRYIDPWDYGNSIDGSWSWLSKNEIQGSYSKNGQMSKYSFKATLDNDKDTGHLKMNGYWYEGAKPTLGKEKGYNSFDFYKDIKSDPVNGQWPLMYVAHPQIESFSNPIDKDKFGGWFSVYCDAGPNEKGYMLYLGVDKNIFRGDKNNKEIWSWTSGNEIQGAFMEHTDFNGLEGSYITFKGSISLDSHGFPMIKGTYSKETVVGEETGTIKFVYIYMGDKWEWSDW